MKLKETIVDFFEKTGFDKDDDNERIVDVYAKTLVHDRDRYTLIGNTLEDILPILSKCDEFKNVTELGIIRRPIVLDANNKNFLAKTMKLSDGYEFSGKVYIYSIGLLLTKKEECVMVRGIFDEERISTPLIDESRIKHPITDDPEKVGFMAFYMERTVIDDENIDVSLKRKIIPAELKDKFIEKFGESPKPSELSKKIIDKFLEENE